MEKGQRILSLSLFLSLSLSSFFFRLFVRVGCCCGQKSDDCNHFCVCVLPKKMTKIGQFFVLILFDFFFVFFFTFLLPNIVVCVADFETQNKSNFHLNRQVLSFFLSLLLFSFSRANHFVVFCFLAFKIDNFRFLGRRAERWLGPIFVFLSLLLNFCIRFLLLQFNLAN